MNSVATSQPHSPPRAAAWGDLRLFSDATIRRIAREHGPQGQVVTAYLRQGILEAKLRWRGRRGFRSRENTKAVQGYALLKPEEFVIINAVQQWANWRTIPRNLSGRVGSQPLRALDLCSGAGDSTLVLACYLPAGSHITGIEIDGRFVEVARQKKFITFDHQPQQVDFSVQDVLQPFMDGQGRLIEDDSIDLINVSGAVAVHFDEQSTATLARQCVRVIKPGGLALVDAGHEGAAPSLVRDCFQKEGFKLIHKAKSCVLDLSRQLCFRYEP